MTGPGTRKYVPYDPEYLESEYRHVDPNGRRYKETDLTAAKPGGDTEYEWRVKRIASQKERWQADIEDEHKSPKPGMQYAGVRPYQGRFWAYSKTNMAQFWKEGKLIHRETGMPRLMQFAEEMPGVSLQDLWTDIPPELGSNDLGYPTQKPEALLERIIKASSNEGDTVLDPFCGCGTAIAVAQRLKRHWIGIDITHLAINLIRHRLKSMFADVPKLKDKPEELLDYKVIGEPVTLSEARALAEQDRFQFQWWALGLVGARPVEQKKGADKGIDGGLYFHDDEAAGTKRVILSVKSGGVSVKDVRDLRGVIEREEAAIGVLICLEEPTQPMRTEAAGAGFYPSPYWNKQHPQLQILTVKELLSGRSIDMPPLRHTNVTFKKAPKARGKGQRAEELFGEGE